MIGSGIVPDLNHQRKGTLEIDWIKNRFEEKNELNLAWEFIENTYRPGKIERKQ